MQRYLMPTCTGFTTSAEDMLMTSGRLVLIQKLSELQAATDFVHHVSCLCICVFWIPGDWKSDAYLRYQDLEQKEFVETQGSVWVDSDSESSE